jgi:hypothetical protein
MIPLCYFGPCNVRYRSGAFYVFGGNTLTLTDSYCRLNQPQVTFGLVPLRPMREPGMHPIPLCLICTVPAYDRTSISVHLELEP